MAPIGELLMLYLGKGLLESTLLGLLGEEGCVMPVAFSLAQPVFTDSQVLLALCHVWEQYIVNQIRRLFLISPMRRASHDLLLRFSDHCPAENSLGRVGFGAD